MSKPETVMKKAPDCIFIGNGCFDLIMSSAGVLAKNGQILQIIDASSRGELFGIVAGYGGVTNKVVSFRQSDYILCENGKVLENMLSFPPKTGRREEGLLIKRWFYLDPFAWNKEAGQLFTEKKCKKIILTDSFSYSLQEILRVLHRKDFQADLMILRDTAGKKITFSYFCRAYKKEFHSCKKILEIPWDKEDMEYKLRAGYEPSQGFMNLSEEYQQAVEEICMETGEDKKSEIRKAFRSFEKNER